MFTETVIHLWPLHSEFSSKSLLRQLCQLTVFLGNLDEQTTKARILCSFCFHSKLFITRKISQLLQLFLPATISAYKVNYMNQSLIQDLDLGSNMNVSSYWSITNVKKYTRYKPFQERHAITSTHTLTHAKAFRSVINHMHKSNFWLHVFTT